MLIGPHILVRLQCWTRGFTNIMQGQPNIIIPQLINAFRQGNFSNVIDAIEASPALVNVDPVVVQLYGGSLRKLAEHKKAAKVFEKGLKILQKRFRDRSRTEDGSRRKGPDQ